MGKKKSKTAQVQTQGGDSAIQAVPATNQPPANAASIQSASATAITNQPPGGVSTIQGVAQPSQPLALVPEAFFQSLIRDCERYRMLYDEYHEKYEKGLQIQVEEIRVLRESLLEKEKMMMEMNAKLFAKDKIIDDMTERIRCLERDVSSLQIEVQASDDARKTLELCQFFSVVEEALVIPRLQGKGHNVHTMNDFFRRASSDKSLYTALNQVLVELGISQQQWQLVRRLRQQRMKLAHPMPLMENQQDARKYCASVLEIVAGFGSDMGQLVQPLCVELVKSYSCNEDAENVV